MLRKKYSLLTRATKSFIDMKVGNGGLAKRVEEEMGSGLNKAPRIANWEERPLLQFQMDYAASDSMVLVDMFHQGAESKES